jgi:hypothetical protein
MTYPGEELVVDAGDPRSRVGHDLVRGPSDREERPGRPEAGDDRRSIGTRESSGPDEQSRRLS